MKKFVPGQGAKPGFLWIIEQIPGMAPAADVTDVLINQGNYWPSYNVYVSFCVVLANHSHALLQAILP